MFKRLVTSFCILLAFAVLQAHNFVPHHHAKDPLVHHGRVHEDNDRSDEGMLARALSHFNHSVENSVPDYITTQSNSPSKKPVAHIDYPELEWLVFHSYHARPPQVNLPVYLTPLPPSIYLCTPVLRGPPALA